MPFHSSRPDNKHPENFASPLDAMIPLRSSMMQATYFTDEEKGETEEEEETPFETKERKRTRLRVFFFALPLMEKEEESRIGLGRGGTDRTGKKALRLLLPPRPT